MKFVVWEATFNVQEATGNIVINLNGCLPDVMLPTGHRVLSPITYHLFTYPLSLIIHHLSLITFITYHLSLITYRLSPFTYPLYQLSAITYHSEY